MLSYVGLYLYTMVQRPDIITVLSDHKRCLRTFTLSISNTWWTQGTQACNNNMTDVCLNTVSSFILNNTAGLGRSSNPIKI